MPDSALNKQALINLLIDSPLREPIKINLIDIVNNTTEPDLPKVFPTIVKELEIFQKATDRRLKLAEETITKLGSPAASTSATTPPPPAPTAPTESTESTESTDSTGSTESTVPADLPLPPLPPLPTPPLPTLPTPPSTPPLPPLAPASEGLSVPPLDLPPLPTPPPTPADSTDEAALADIQKELDALKTGATEDAGTKQE